MSKLAIIGSIGGIIVFGLLSGSKATTDVLPELSRSVLLNPTPPPSSSKSLKILWIIGGTWLLMRSVRLYFQLKEEAENYKTQLTQLRQENNRNIAELQRATAVTNPPTSNVCVVCWDNTRNVVIYPCKHLGMCNVCVASLKASRRYKCPVCQQNISRHEIVYTP